MKRKILFSIVGIALFAVAIGFGLNEKQEENLQIKNIEVLASMEDYPGPCGGASTCDLGDFCYIECEWVGGFKP